MNLYTYQMVITLNVCTRRPFFACFKIVCPAVVVRDSDSCGVTRATVLLVMLSFEPDFNMPSTSMTFCFCFRTLGSASFSFFRQVFFPSLFWGTAMPCVFFLLIVGWSKITPFCLTSTISSSSVSVSSLFGRLAFRLFE
jgi:hypothetical protein